MRDKYAPPRVWLDRTRGDSYTLPAPTYTEEKRARVLGLKKDGWIRVFNTLIPRRSVLIQKIRKRVGREVEFREHGKKATNLRTGVGARSLIEVGS